MGNPNFNLRNISPEVMFLLKKKSAEEKISINSLILQTLEQGLGLSHLTPRKTFHDLDSLAGTWSEKERKEFEEKTQAFETIDRDIWI